MTALDLEVEAIAGECQRQAAELQSSDLEDLTKFLAAIFGGEFNVWQDWFTHWWALNPAWRASIPRGWLVRSTTGTLIAFTANIPFPYVIESKPALCCATGSTAVDPNWRGLGVGKAVGRKFLNQAHGDLLVGVDSTDVAHGLWRSLGMKSLERNWLQAHSRILADGVALGTALSKRARLPNLVGRAVGNCLALLLDSAVSPTRRSKSISIMKIDEFAESDTKAIEFCSASNATTCSLRDIITLNWLYFGTQYLKRSRAVFVARSGMRLVGYLAIKQWHEHSYYLLECRCRDADPEIARELIFAAREFARQHRARSILVRPYTPMIEAAIPRTASVRVSLWPTTYCYKFKTDRVNVEEWEAAPGDGDVSVN